MSNIIIFNSSNVVGNTNSQFRYNFPQGSFTIKKGRICVIQVIIPYSNFNITSTYENNSFSYNFPTVGQSNQFTSFNVLLPNGNYSIPDINRYMESVFISNGQYVIDSNGNNIYFAQFIVDPVYYAIQILTFPMYTATTLPVGYTLPSNFYGYPVVGICPQININNAEFGKIIGYNVGLYGSTIETTPQSFLSNTTPSASVVNGVIMRVNLVNNSASIPSDILTSFGFSGAVFGSNIIYTPPFEQFVKINPGTYSFISLSLVDQSLNTIPFNDPNVLITLLLESE